MIQRWLSAWPPVTRYFVFVAFSLGTAFAFINDPEQPGLAAALLHVIQWQLQTLVPIALLIWVQHLVSRAPLRLLLGPWASLIGTGVIASLLFAPLALAVDWLFLGDPYSPAELVDEWLGMAPPVVVCWIAMNAPLVLGFRLARGNPVEGVDSSRASPSPGAAPADVSRPPQKEELAADQLGNADGAVNADSGDLGFLAEVPESARGDLVYLKAELHYVSVVTTRGRTLILYNLRDAMDQLPETSGMQTHRGYWVAFDQVTALARAGRQGEIHVSNGDTVPVSRTRMPAVRERLSSVLSEN